MNRLARKYRDMGNGPVKPAFPTVTPHEYGFVLDRKGIGTEAEPKEESETPIVENVDIQTISEGEKTFVIATDNSLSKEWLQNEADNETSLTALEKSVFVRSEKLVERLAISTESSDESGVEEEDLFKPVGKRKAVWIDDDDDEEQSAKNRHYYEQLVGQPKWAKQSSDHLSSDEDEGDDSSFRRMRDYLKANSNTSATQISPLSSSDQLEFVRCNDLNAELRHFARITSVDFHPQSTLALVASHDSSLKLFQVDGKQNSLIHSLVMKQWPIERASFNAATQEIVMQCAVPQPSFYIYDLTAEKTTYYNRYKCHGCTPFHNMTISPDGSMMAFSSRDGYVRLISSKTKELMFDVKRNSQVASLAFTDNLLFASGNDCEVFVWDIRQQKTCLNRFNDFGCIHGTSIATSSDSKYLTTGSDSGIVNLYDLDSCLIQRDPKPLKAFKNIVTPVSGVTINHSSDLLLSWSSHGPRTVKAANIRNLRVFSNFPEPEDMRLKNITVVTMSPNSGYLAAGNSNGRVLLWRLRHFCSY